jgi:hypothetical protein
MTQPVQQEPMATPEQVAQAKASIRQVRDIVARFHKIRRKNNERAAGLRPAMMFPQQVQEVLRTNRNPQAEQQAVEALRGFLRILRGHEPTRQDMQEGIPSGAEDQLGMVMIPAAIAVGLASAGASVYSVFNYLTTIEERMQQQEATPLDRLLQGMSDNIWGVAAVGAVGLGAAYYYKSTKKEEREHELKMEKARAKSFRKNPEEESLTEKVSEFVKNTLFPPEKNPSLSPGEKLASRMKSLSKEEQEKFYASLDGDDIEEEEEEEIEEEEEEEERKED